MAAESAPAARSCLANAEDEEEEEEDDDEEDDDDDADDAEDTADKDEDDDADVEEEGDDVESLLAPRPSPPRGSSYFCRRAKNAARPCITYIAIDSMSESQSYGDGGRDGGVGIADAVPAVVVPATSTLVCGSGTWRVSLWVAAAAGEATVRSDGSSYANVAAAEVLGSGGGTVPGRTSARNARRMSSSARSVTEGKNMDQSMRTSSSPAAA